MATKLASGVASLVNGFTGLDSRTKTIIVAVAGLAAAIGPLSLAIGGIIQALPLLGAGFAALTGPIGLTVAAIAGLAFVVVKNWDLIKKTLDDAGITDVFVGLVDNIKELASVIGGVLVEKFNSSKSSVLGLLEVFKPFLSFVKDQLISNLKFLAEVVSQSFGFISDLIKGDFSTAFLRLEIIVASVSKRIIESIKPLIDFIGFGSQFEQVISNIDKKISQNKAIIAGREAFMSYGSAVKETAKSIDKDSDIIAKSIQKIGRTQQNGITLEKNKKPSDSNFGALPKISGGIIDKPNDGLTFFQRLSNEIDSFAPSIIEKLTTFAFAVDDILRNSIGNAFLDLGNSIGEAIATGGNVIQAIGQSLLKSIGNFLGQLGQQLIAFGVAGLNFGKLSLALANPLTAIKAAPLAIAAGVALTAVAGAIGSLGKGGVGGGQSIGSSGVGGGSAQNFGGAGLESSLLASGLTVGGTIEIDGTKLLIALQNAEKKTK